MTAPRKQAPEDGLTSPSFGACLLIRGGLELDFFKDLVVHPVRIFHLAWAGFLQGFVVVCGGRQPTGVVRLALQKSFSKRNLHFLTWWTTMVCLKIVNTPRPHAFFRLIGGFHPLVKFPLTCPLRRDCPKSRPPPQPLDWLRRRRLQGGRAHCTKKILQKAAKEKGYTDTLFFVDDGITGTTMKRPGFQKMIQAIENGYNSAVFVKDLSRLGRNYIEVGRLTEEFFPAHDVRLVAVSDGVDSDEGENEFTPFKNIMNEFMAKDTSRKIKSAFRAKFLNGERVNYMAPFGYVKLSSPVIKCKKTPRKKYRIVAEVKGKR